MIFLSIEMRSLVLHLKYTQVYLPLTDLQNLSPPLTAKMKPIKQNARFK